MTINERIKQRIWKGQPGTVALAGSALNLQKLWREIDMPEKYIGQWNVIYSLRRNTEYMSIHLVYDAAIDFLSDEDFRETVIRYRCSQGARYNHRQVPRNGDGVPIDLQAERKRDIIRAAVEGFQGQKK